jgi:hypothetical protein
MLHAVCDFTNHTRDATFKIAIIFFDRDYVRIDVVLTLVKNFNNNSIQLFILLDKSTAIGSNYSVIRKNKQKCGGNNTQM